jgi:Fe-S-cluster containining protein
MPQHWTLDIAGCACPLTEPEAVLRGLQGVFAEVQRRADAYRQRPCNPHLCRAGCPLLHQHLCGVYDHRPFLCRAYGFPTDASAVETEAAIVVRSLCHLYDGLALPEVIAGRDLKQAIAELSERLGGGRRWGRFTSIEAILASIRRPMVMPGGHVLS